MNTIFYHDIANYCTLQLLAEALLGFLDRDRNGVLEGGELKAMLAILGFAPALLMPIPSFMRIEYKAILRTLGGHLERKA